jgi:hypothetical protein
LILRIFLPVAHKPLLVIPRVDVLSFLFVPNESPLIDEFIYWFKYLLYSAKSKKQTIAINNATVLYNNWLVCSIKSSDLYFYFFQRLSDKPPEL